MSNCPTGPTNFDSTAMGFENYIYKKCKKVTFAPRKILRFQKYVNRNYSESNAITPIDAFQKLKMQLYWTKIYYIASVIVGSQSAKKKKPLCLCDYVP